MNEEWWESPTCWLCNYWWALLAALTLALLAYFTRDFWLPLLGVEPPVPTPPPTLVSQPAPTATRVSELGTGDVQVTLIWSTVNDIDLHVIDPQENRIFYGAVTSPTGGRLDVDANAGCAGALTPSPVENIFWPTGAAPTGTYRVEVVYFAHCSGAPLEDQYTVRVLVDGKAEEFSGTLIADDERDLVYEFTR